MGKRKQNKARDLFEIGIMHTAYIYSAVDKPTL